MGIEQKVIGVYNRVTNKVIIDKGVTNVRVSGMGLIGEGLLTLVKVFVDEVIPRFVDIGWNHCKVFLHCQNHHNGCLDS